MPGEFEGYPIDNEGSCFIDAPAKYTKDNQFRPKEQWKHSTQTEHTEMHSLPVAVIIHTDE